jgi:hypothetical protein
MECASTKLPRDFGHARTALVPPLPKKPAIIASHHDERPRPPGNHANGDTLGIKLTRTSVTVDGQLFDEQCRKPPWTTRVKESDFAIARHQRILPQGIARSRTRALQRIVLEAYLACRQRGTR